MRWICFRLQIIYIMGSIKQFLQHWDLLGFVIAAIISLLISLIFKETFLTSNFGLFENASNCVHTPIEVEDTPPDHFIFEIQVKGPQRLVLSQSQYTPSSRGNQRYALIP